MLHIANRDFDLWKKDGWDSVSIGRIEEATVEGRGAEVGAVVCGEGQSVTISADLVRHCLTILVVRACSETLFSPYSPILRLGDGLSLDGTHDDRPTADRGSGSQKTQGL